ncbi:PDR/VanB family oxidoreductase [Streptomyces fuscigenes]|uniref:PDR/VanB family oxidoreductase n=1 Tax=Streptomyces fuscigenes TaxID=1528880 RepID=UPI001F2A5898|nr:PDR/VanB family oxidoreductase [Streptomyces fuscigenes]MCF3960714.1 PDR/VanB family oxidoreductase [Streptomyces fuscigenes]
MSFHADEFDVVVARRESVADGVVRLSLADPAGAPLPPWEPGAHLDLLLAPGLERQYSLCGDPADRSVLRIAVARDPAGRGGSRHVHAELTEGTVLRARGPRNHFPLVEAARYLFVAGGIGITPLAAMIGALAARGAEWRLVYGGRTRASMAFAASLAAAHPDRVEICPQDETGLLDLSGLLGVPRTDTAVYCCGPEPLLAAVEERCAAWPAGALHTERFAPRPGPPPETGPRTHPSAAEGAFEVELAASGRTLTVPPGRSILEVVEDAGVQVLSSCREGTCGTCETDVLAGEPDHRDALLTADERAANDVMFICVSRCRSERLVLDL